MSNHLNKLFSSSGATNGTTAQEDKINLRNELQAKRATRKTTQKPNGVSNTTSLTNNRSQYFSIQFQNSQPAMNSVVNNQITNDFVSSPLKFKIPNFSRLPPLELASEFINGVNNRDSDTPSLNEVFTKYQIDNYNFRPVTGLKNFTRFEKISILNIPDDILRDYSNTKCVTSMGIFPELNKCWLTVDNKLILWDFEDLGNANYSTIDEIKHTILAVSLIKPKSGVFVENVNYLLLISTPMDIYVLAIEYNHDTKKMDIFNTGMTVSTQGLIVNNFITYEGTNDVFFTGLGDGINIWKLNYSNKQDWFTNKCSKECLTRSGISTILPDSLSGINIFHNNSTVPNPNNIKQEYITQLEMDQSRGILYTLSSRSIVRAYKLKIDKQNNITTPTEIAKTGNDILKDLSTTGINISSPLLQRKTFKITKIFHVSRQESNNLYLVIVLDNGVRIYLNGASYSGFGSSTTTLGRLTANFVKFPPADFQFFEKIEKRTEEQKRLAVESKSQVVSSNAFSSILTKDKQQQQQQQQQHLLQGGEAYTPAELKSAQESSALLKSLKNARIISPGIYFGITKSDKENEDKLFVATPDYGVLKKDKLYVEDFEFLDTFGKIHDIIPLTTNSSKDSNLLASQYVDTPLTVAILTSSGLHVYRYRNLDAVLEDSLDDLTFKELAAKNGSEEACSSALYLSCRYGKSDAFKNKATQLFINGGKNGDINKSLTSVLDNVELSDRFFASVMLIARLFKNTWQREVFALNSNLVKFERDGFVNETVLKKKIEELKEQPLTGLNLSKSEIEYLLSSVLVVGGFFEKTASKIPGLGPQNFSSFDLANDRNLDIILQAENMSFKALLQFLDSVKEALSFLIVLLEEADPKTGLKDVFQYLSVQSQLDLSCLTLADFLAPTSDYVKQLIKEILSAIINKNISKGSSVEFITTSLQERCGTFCSGDDVIIYKAIENFKKAKELYFKDYELSKKYLSTAVKLFEKSDEKSLSPEIVQSCVEIMIDMKCYDDAIGFLLELSNKEPKISKTSFYNDQSTQVVKKENSANMEKKLQYYDIIFKLLIDIDTKAIQSLQQKSNITEFSKLRDSAYQRCFNYKDKTFHFELYKFLIEQNCSDKLLDVNSDYILPFLEEYSSNDINIAYLLCNYHLKRFNYLEAANILVSITIAFEDLDDDTKIQLLCKSKVYLNAADSTNNSSKLSAAIDELINSLVVE